MNKIHFICRGNVYRSRMAEAYLKSRLSAKEAVFVYSSGIEAKKALNGDVDPVAVEELSKDNISDQLSNIWVQTSQANLDQADFNVFMSNSLVADAKKQYDIDDTKVIVWNIPDIDGVYEDIKLKVDELIVKLCLK